MSRHLFKTKELVFLLEILEKEGDARARPLASRLKEFLAPILKRSRSNGGRPSSCSCGDCPTCRHRAANRRYENRAKRDAPRHAISDEELTKRLVAKFEREGW